MIELLPAFFVASAVVGSAAAASVGALSKAACLRLFRSNGQRLSVSLLLGTSCRDHYHVYFLGPSFHNGCAVRNPATGKKTMFFAVLFSMSAAFHIAFAWIPNLYLLSRTSTAPNGSNNTFADLVWAGLLASMTPCAVVLIVLGLWLSYFR